MAEKAVITVEGRLPSKDREVGVLDVNIPINIRNATSVAFTSATVAIKDEDTETVREARFGRINPRNTGSQTVSMPGGVESALYRIEVEGHDPIIGGGFADDATEVNITITE
jgi:hypothetical protein